VGPSVEVRTSIMWRTVCRLRGYHSEIVACRKFPLLRCQQPTFAVNVSRKTSTLEVASAVGGAGPPIPPVGFAAGAEQKTTDPQSLNTLSDVITELHKQGACQAEQSELQPFVERALYLANNADLDQIADLADCFVQLRLRIPLRDLVPTATARLSRQGPEALSNVLRIASATGKGSLFFIELFEFAKEHRMSMNASDISTFLYECGRHGLRCKHLMDPCVERAAELAPQMSLLDIMRTSQGLLRFSRDWKAFFIAVRARLMSGMGNLSAPQLLLTLRISRDLRHIQDFADLHAALCTELVMRANELSLNQGAQCLMCTTYSPKYRAQAQALVRTIEKKWSCTEELEPLRISEVVDALDTFASWQMHPKSLVERLDSMLVSRNVELKYTGNVSLWWNAVASLSKMSAFDSTYPFVALEWSRDKAFLQRMSTYNLCQFVHALSRLRICDEVAYDHIANLVIAEFHIIKQIDDLAPLLFSYASVGYYHKELFNQSYDKMVEWFDQETLDVSAKGKWAFLVQAVWSFTAAGYHKQYDSFAAFLDYVFFSPETNTRASNIRRQASLADAVLEDAPEIAAQCQYPEELEQARSSPKVRKLIASSSPCQPLLLQDLRSTLQELGWPYEVFTMPNERASLYVDISLKPKFGQPVGLLLAGNHELVRVGLPKEGQSRRASGGIELSQRLLSRHGWHTALVDSSAWDALTNIEQKQAYLEAAVQSALAGTQKP